MSNISEIHETMSSRDISELTGKKHKDVLRDIRAYIGAFVKIKYGNNIKSMDWYNNTNDFPEGTLIAGVFHDTETNTQNKQKYPIYRLNQEATLNMIAGYNLLMRIKVIEGLINTAPFHIITDERMKELLDAERKLNETLK